MNKRKKLIKLFYAIQKFIEKESIPTDAHTFLLNKFFLTVNDRKTSASLLSSINRDIYSQINTQFKDRFVSKEIKELSFSQIVSLPEEKIISTSFKSPKKKPAILFLSPHIVCDYESEKNAVIFFGYPQETKKREFFFHEKIVTLQIPKNLRFNISLQTTLIDIINNDESPIQPDFFNIVFDESLFSENFTEESHFNISSFLNNNGFLHLFHKRNFFSSPNYKKEKNSLLSYFDFQEIICSNKHSLIKTAHKNKSSENISLKNLSTKTSLLISKKDLCFNNLLTFNEDMTKEEYEVLQKIETTAKDASLDFFKFFIGMFPVHKSHPVVENFKSTAQHKPLIRANEIVPFSLPSASSWIMPEKEKFFQIPPSEQFESKKILIRYLSNRPVCCIDSSSLYFMSDTSAIIPKKSSVLFEYAEAYFNSNILIFYYISRFPHHTKFLKKNFQMIPFFNCGQNIQRIIQDSVNKIRNMYKSFYNSDTDISSLEKMIEKEKSTLNNYMYQLFRLNNKEISIIEKFLKSTK